MSHNDTLAAVGAAFIALNDCDNDVRRLREALAGALAKRDKLRSALMRAQSRHSEAAQQAPVATCN